mgnify:CR=1 FL=1|jgi:DNA (cytosine-5)-methyltransferase 1
MNKTFKVLDLFCGCGGLSHGFIECGYDVCLGIDHWQDALTTFSYNHKKTKTLLADLQTLAPEDVCHDFGLAHVDVIIGGPPCQGFSIAGKRIIDDERNKLYKAFVRFIHFFRPEAFVMENVPNILSIGNGQVRDSILNDFTTLGYNVVYKVLCASEYGVPQNRRRTFFVGLKNSTFIFPKHSVSIPVTAKEAISDLPEQSINDGDAYPVQPESDFQKIMRRESSAVFNHQATVHTQRTKQIISLVPDGGNYLDLPAELQHTRKVHIAWTRLNSNKPSITIDTGHNHHFHYLFNRVPTARESARLQSFPDDFVFLCGKTSQLKQIGNAVPPLLAEEIAKQLKGYLS